jgi:RHS repeat-associated protein
MSAPAAIHPKLIHRWWVASWVLALGLTGAVDSYAAPKDGVGLSKISLPSGPGSIEGLGDSFEPQLNSGTSAYGVRVTVPPGVNGLQPDIALHYNAGSGNGPFGLAWSWAPMSIQRQTEKGLPTYTANDVFTFQGEELVRLDDGSYRVENESGFMRITRSADGWEVRDKSGTAYRLGTIADARQSRPGVNTFLNAFKWCVNEVVDTHSNRMEFHYTTYGDSPGQLYCTEIRYSISRSDPAIFHSVVFDYELRPDAFNSFLSGFEIKTARRCREIRLLSRGGLVRRYVLGYEVNPADQIEPISANDAGLMFSLLRRVTQFDNRDAAQASYLPPLQFAYTRFDAAAGVLGELTNPPPHSLANTALAFADINCDSLPDLFYTDPLTGQHTVYYNLGEGVFSGPTNFVSFPWPATLDTPETELADYDGDGRIDLVQKSGDTAGRFVYYANTTLPLGNDDSRPAWSLEKSFQSPFPPFALGDPSVRTLDLDGDKRMDFIRTTEFGFIYFYNRTNQWQQDGIHLFGEPSMGDLTAAEGVQFSVTGPGGGAVPNQLVKLADMNGDRLLDLVKLTVAGATLDLVYWPNKGRAAWEQRRVMTGTINLGVIPIEDVFVMDINGDGLSDIVGIGHDYIKYWINRGDGSFSPEFTRSNMPMYVPGTTVLRQADINGNGSTDFLWENWEPSLGRFRIQYYDFLGAAKPNLLRLIDNGIGLRTEIEYKTSTDYYVASRRADHPWRTRLPFASTVVSKITRRIGLDLDGAPGPDEYVTEFSYRDGYYEGFEKEFRGFAFAKKVELGDDRHPGVTVHSPTTVTRFAFHTGTPDGIDNNEDGVFDEFNEQSGYEEEPIKGRVLWTEITLPTADIGGSYAAQMDGQPADDGVVFRRDYNTWKIKTIHSPSGGFTYRDAFDAVQASLSLPHATMDGKRVSFAFLANRTTELIEANGALADTTPFMPVRARKILYTESDVDFFGNTIVEKNYGEHSSGSIYDDERFTYSTYAFNLSDWLIGFPARKLVTDESGNFVSESRNYYDGSPFIGLPLGQVGSSGNLMREEKFINGANPVPAFSTISKIVGDPRLGANVSVNANRNRYDEFGNLVETRDPLYVEAGQGHGKEYAYDSTFNTYVVRETIHVGNGSPDLIATVGYDLGAGVMLAATNFNNHATGFQYDSFWRLVGIVKPGDSATFPTATFSYRPGDPFRSLYYNYDSLGDLTVENTGDPHVASTVTTHQREQAGTENTFDTISFTDGAGHKLGTLHENDISGQWVAKDFKRFSSQGEERKAFLPFVASSSIYSIPPETSYNVASFYDGANRVVRTVNPPETTNALAPVTETLTSYLPLEAHLYDEEQVNTSSPRFGAHHVQLKDGLDRLIGVIEAVHINDDGTPSRSLQEWLTSYEYDLNDNLTHITDSQGNQKWFRYDGLGRKLFMNDLDRGTMTWTYDDASNLRETVDAKAQHITYAYDGVNRLLTEDYLDAFGRTPDVTYHYDAPAGAIPVGDGTSATGSNTKGMLAWVQDLSGEEHASYGARGRVESVIKRIPDPQFLSTIDHQPSVALVSFRTGFAYDSLDRLTTLTYADNDQVSNLYNARNLLARITGGPSGSIISNILYRASDQLQQIDYGNGVRTTYDYDPRLRLNSLLTISQPGTPMNQLINFAYDFDAASNIKRISDNRPVSAVSAGDARRNTQIFQYDDLYRITRAQYSFAAPGTTADNGNINYRYDRIGNMLAQTSDIAHYEKGLSMTQLGDISYGGASGRASRIGRDPADAAGPHALTSVSQLSTNNPQPRIYPYDANGNMLVIDGLTNTWDFKDRLIALEDSEMRAEYTYDYTDRRIIKRVWTKVPQLSTLNSQPTSVLYPNKYFEVREHDAPTKYIWNGNTRVARSAGSLTTNQRVQRLRLWPGWNLVSLAVTATNALQQLESSASHSATGERDQREVVLLSAYQWNPATNDWETVAPNSSLLAGTVLWLNVATNTTAQVTGIYTDPVNRSATAGANLQPGAGLEAWPVTNTPLANLVAWKFDARNQSWRVRYGRSLGQSDFPAVLAVGDGMMSRADDSTTLEVPDSVLRIRYYHQDHLGSSAVLTGTDAHLVEEATYYSFGHQRNQLQVRTVVEAYKFGQKEQDGESSLQYFEARFLAENLGKFICVDALLLETPQRMLGFPQRHNAYAYALNNPVVLRDPSGRESVGEIIERKGVEATTTWGIAGALTFTALGTAWDMFGAEHISKLSDKYWNGRKDVSGSDYALAVLEVPGVSEFLMARTGAEALARGVGSFVERGTYAPLKKEIYDLGKTVMRHTSDPEFRAMDKSVFRGLRQFSRRDLREVVEKGARHLIQKGAESSVEALFNDKESGTYNSTEALWRAKREAPDTYSVETRQGIKN